jgi:uncharacterized protein (TIGR03067 family)
MTVRVLTVLVVGSLLPLSAQAEEKGKKDAELIQGTWSPVSLEKSGMKAPDEVTREAKIRFDAEGKGKLLEKPGKESEFTYTLAPDKKIKEIDLIINDGGRERLHKGIYFFLDDTITLCFGHDGDERPTDFGTQAGDKRLLLVLKRDKN